jgi:hypothetical protein
VKSGGGSWLASSPEKMLCKVDDINRFKPGWLDLQQIPQSDLEELIEFYSDEFKRRVYWVGKYVEERDVGEFRSIPLKYGLIVKVGVVVIYSGLVEVGSYTDIVVDKIYSDKPSVFSKGSVLLPPYISGDKISVEYYVMGVSLDDVDYPIPSLVREWVAKRVLIDLIYNRSELDDIAVKELSLGPRSESYGDRGRMSAFIDKLEKDIAMIEEYFRRRRL